MPADNDAAVAKVVSRAALLVRMILNLDLLNRIGLSRMICEATKQIINAGVVLRSSSTWSRQGGSTVVTVRAMIPLCLQVDVKYQLVLSMSKSSYLTYIFSTS